MGNTQDDRPNRRTALFALAVPLAAAGSVFAQGQGKPVFSETPSNRLNANAQSLFNDVNYALALQSPTDNVRGVMLKRIARKLENPKFNPEFRVPEGNAPDFSKLYAFNMLNTGNERSMQVSADDALKVLRESLQKEKGKYSDKGNEIIVEKSAHIGQIIDLINSRLSKAKKGFAARVEGNRGQSQFLG